MSERHNGTVKWFNDSKGYGFITPDTQPGNDVFVHVSDVEKSGLDGLTEGDKVSYEHGEGKKGPKAINLKGE